MKTYIKIFILGILAGLVSVGFAQEAAITTVDINESAVQSFPYVAEITGDNVHIRSGPGTNYYICGRLNKGDRLKVVGSRFSWSRVVPPTGSFSWISMRHVKLDVDNPGIGIVTGDSVRVYAGSEYREPIHSETLQLKLNKSDKVKLMGEEKGDYYKIVPPAGAYFWVSTEFIKPAGLVGKVPPPIIVPTPKTTEKTTATTTVQTPADTNTVAPIEPTVEAEKLKEYYALEEQIRVERAKPIDQQNYEKIEKALAEIAGNKEAGKAAKYSNFVLKQIERFKLAKTANKEVQLENAKLQQIQEKIDKSRDTRLAQVEDLGRFVVIGKLETSNVYGSEGQLKRYRVVDDADKTVCYALPIGAAAQADLSKLVGSKVGLVGTIEPNLQTAGALVQFTEAVELK